MIGPCPVIARVVALAIALSVGAWQHRIGGAPGEIVEGVDEVEQTMITVIATPMHSVAGRPGFGSLVHTFVDMPVNRIGPELTREVFRALAACAVDKVGSPLVIVKRVTPTYDPDTGKLVPEIGWLPAKLEASQIRSTRVNLG